MFTFFMIILGFGVLIWLLLKQAERRMRNRYGDSSDGGWLESIGDFFGGDSDGGGGGDGGCGGGCGGD